MNEWSVIDRLTLLLFTKYITRKYTYDIKRTYMYDFEFRKSNKLKRIAQHCGSLALQTGVMPANVDGSDL